MKHAHKPRQVVREALRRMSLDDEYLCPSLPKPYPNPATRVAIEPPDDPNGPPATSELLTPTIAWRRLCEETGCGVGLIAFYKWIYAGRIPSVRRGARTYITSEVVDEFVKRGLSGIGW